MNRISKLLRALGSLVFLGAGLFYVFASPRTTASYFDSTYPAVVWGWVFVNGGGGDGGYLMYHLPEAARPKGSVRLITATSGTTQQRIAVANISSNGEVRLQPILGDCQWMSLDGLRWPLD